VTGRPLPQLPTALRRPISAFAVGRPVPQPLLAGATVSSAGAATAGRRTPRPL